MTPDYDNSGAGAAYVYLFTGATWAQQQELTAGDGSAGDVFGTKCGGGQDHHFWLVQTVTKWKPY